MSTEPAPVRGRRHALNATAALVVVLLASACASARPAGPPAATRLEPVSFSVSEGTRLTLDVTPDGQAILFDLLGQLWRVPIGGGDAVAITDAVRETSEDLDPAVSPDGRRIVFQSDRPGGRALWIMPSEGGPAGMLATRPLDYFVYATPSWAPDGRRIAYAVREALVVLDVETGEETELAVDSLPALRPGPPWTSRTAVPSWSPDGTRIVFGNAAGDNHVWEVDATGGVARQLTATPAQAPVYSPDGTRLAYFARGPENRWQLFVQEIARGEPARLTDHEEVIPVRARWTPDGRSVVYSAEGGLWHVGIDESASQRIPFTARVSLQRERPARPHVVRFPEPNSEQPAIGFTNYDISPDGRTIALLALDTLWLIVPGEPPRALAAATNVDRQFPRGMAWSPDGREIVWAHSPARERHELVAADARTGALRTLAVNEGGFHAMRWSPDGRWVAYTNAQGRLLLVPAQPSASSPGEDTRDLGAVSIGWGTLAWAPGSDALVAGHLDLGATPSRTRAEWIPLDGERRTIESWPAGPSHLQLYAGGRAVYVQDNLLWQAMFEAGHGVRGEAVALSEDPAIEARYANDGSILYLSSDGMRIRRPSGDVVRIGWPLSYRTPDAPPPLLIRDVRVIDGTGASPSEPRDILLRSGRISTIGPAHTIAAADAQVLDAGGRWAIPGLIDLHAHIWDDADPTNWLHSGVTTVRDISSQRIKTPDLRNLVNAGARPGPRIVYAGGMFHRGVGITSITDQFVSDSAAAERGVAIMAALGAEYIKERGFLDWWGAVDVVRAAHRYGLPVSGHCSHLLPVVAAGMDGREHTGDCYRDWGIVREDFTALHAAAGQWVVTTGAIHLGRLAVIDDPSLVESEEFVAFVAPRWSGFYATDSAAIARRPTIEAALRRVAHGIGAYHQRGVLLGTGSDTGTPWRIQHEMQVLVLAGLTPMEALLAATANAARIVSAPEIGTVEEGKLADLVLLDANPLDDIRNTGRIWQVVKGGQVVDRAALRARERR